MQRVAKVALAQPLKLLLDSVNICRKMCESVKVAINSIISISKQGKQPQTHKQILRIRRVYALSAYVAQMTAHPDRLSTSPHFSFPLCYVLLPPLPLPPSAVQASASVSLSR